MATIATAMSRLLQTMLIVATLLGSWLGMQAAHESGHVLSAWLTGAHVTQIVLHPLTISRTDLGGNPRPAIVVWAGPVVGVFLPLVVWGAAAWRRASAAFVARFWAGFCLVANGVYIGAGSFVRVGDCQQMLQCGAPPWTLWLYGGVTAPLGFWLWHRLGPHFGVGANSHPIQPRVAWTACVVCLGLVALGLVIDGR